MNTDESPLTFPCDFPIKAMGRKGGALEHVVMDIMRRHVGDITECTVQVRESKGGNYLSMTVTFRAESRAQLDAIYQELSDCEEVLMAL
jgi:putative lipoic acid-binding regulatory protein